MNKSGLVYLDDLDNQNRETIYSDMQKFSHLFRSIDEKWWPDLPLPRDPLSQWSRQFEYPYCWWHCQSTQESGRRVLDAGSGITFFPFYMALQGWHVSCVDRDSRLRKAFRLANSNMPQRLQVDFAQGDLASIAYKGGSFSHIICLSVLEHIPQDKQTHVLEEFARVILPGGILLLTMDINLDRGLQTGVGPSAIHEFVAKLKDKGFELIGGFDGRYELDRLLATDHFLIKDPERLPWTIGPASSYRKRVRHWVKTILFGRASFESLCLAVFACRRTYDEA